MAFNDDQNASFIRLMNEGISSKTMKFVSNEISINKYITPGDVITSDRDFMRGHGTYHDDESQLIASVAGVIEPINRLITVRPLRTRYNGEIGDVIVARVIEVQQKRWKLEINSRLDAVLLLSGVNLPGGELRRKTYEDEIMMRQMFTEGDLISAEVHNIFEDGALCLQTRNLKYGKLGQGLLVRVSPSLIKRRKIHFHNLPCGVHIILANNGFIWISPIIAQETGGFVLDLNPVSSPDRETIARLRNCILALAQHKIMLDDTSVLCAFDISKQLAFKVKDLLLTEVMSQVAYATKLKLDEAMNQMA